MAFLHDLQQNHGDEGSTINQAVSGLRLFFRDHLGRADWTCWAQIPIKRTTSLPTVLPRGEVRVLLASVKEPRFVAVFSLMDDCGLRLGEACWEQGTGAVSDFGSACVRTTESAAAGCSKLKPAKSLAGWPPPWASPSSPYATASTSPARMVAR